MKQHLMNKAANRGFTLIEMMVALSIFSALMAVLMLGYSQGLSLWERGRKHTSHWQSLEYRYGLLATVFAQAQAADYQRIGGIYVPFFHGDPEKMTLMTRAPILDFVGRVRPVELKLDQQADKTYTLTYREADRYSDPARGIHWENAQWTTLMDKLTSASFRFEASAFPLPEELDPNYLDANDKLRYRDKAQWLEHFNSHAIWRIPQRVELRFTDRFDHDHQWTFPLPRGSDAWSLEVYTAD